MAQLRRLSAAEIESNSQILAGLLIDSVDAGASMGFHPPLSMDKAQSFFAGVGKSVGNGDALLLGAFLDGRLIGSVQLKMESKENGSHRAEVAKLLVHSSFRGQGIATELMNFLAEVARANNRTLLMLDTETGSAAEFLYRKLGWQELGVVPGHTIEKDGTPSSTTFFWRKI
jgi:GNAT superfamily N-acetyltransferase